MLEHARAAASDAGDARRRAAGGGRRGRDLREGRAQVDATRVAEGGRRLRGRRRPRDAHAAERRARREPARDGAPARAAKAAARLAGRDFVTPDDVARIAPAVFRAPARAAPGGRARALPPGRRRADRARQTVPVPDEAAELSPTPRTARADGRRSPCARCSCRSGSACSPRSRSSSPPRPTRSRAPPARGRARGAARSSRAACQRRCVSMPAPTRGALRVRQPVPPDLRLDPAEADGELDASGHAAPPRPAHAARAVDARRRPARPGRVAPPRWRRRPRSLVYPDLPDGAAARARGAPAAASGSQGRLRAGRSGLGTEFESVRDYLPDDDLRQVNWRATERLGRPMSNQYRIERDRDVICLVDCGRLMAAPLGDRTRLDAAIDAAVAVARSSADVLGDRVGVDRVRRATCAAGCAAPPGGEGRRARRCSTSSRVSIDSRLRARVRARRGESKRAFVLVSPTCSRRRAARPLLDAIPMLARRHAVVIASATDLDLAAMVDDPPDDADRRLPRGGGGRRARRPRRASRTCSARGARGDRGARGRARRGVRDRLPPGQGARPRVTEHAVVIAGGGPDGADAGGRAGAGGGRRRDRRAARRSASSPAHAPAASTPARSRCSISAGSRIVFSPRARRLQAASVRLDPAGHQRLPDAPPLHARDLAEPDRADHGRAGSPSFRCRIYYGTRGDRLHAGRRPASTSSWPTVEPLRAQYLVGCDGGRSVVRKAAGIEFPGWDPTTEQPDRRGRGDRGAAAVESRHDAIGVHGRRSGCEDGKPVRVVMTERRGRSRSEPTLRRPARRRSIARLRHRLRPPQLHAGSRASPT